MSRIFTDEELQEMIIPTSTRIRNAFQSGDKETAKKLWNKLVDDYMWAFDLRVNWDKAFTDYIYNELGETHSTKCGDTGDGQKNRSDL